MATNKGEVHTYSGVTMGVTIVPTREESNCSREWILEWGLPAASNHGWKFHVSRHTLEEATVELVKLKESFPNILWRIRNKSTDEIIPGDAIIEA